MPPPKRSHRMKCSASIASSLSAEVRKTLAIETLSKSEPISQLADDFQVSRQFGKAHPHWLEMLGFERFKRV
ncbi:MAG: hypothetical protein AAF978_05040 [Cyanobacteria bacterium P01_E01_bin.48]